MEFDLARLQGCTGRRDSFRSSAARDLPRRLSPMTIWAYRLPNDSGHSSSARSPSLFAYLAALVPARCHGALLEATRSADLLDPCHSCQSSRPWSGIICSPKSLSEPH